MGTAITILAIVFGSLLLGVALFVAVLRFMLGSPVSTTAGSSAFTRVRSQLDNKRLWQLAFFGGFLIFWGTIIEWGAWWLHISPFGEFTGLSEESLKFGLFLVTGAAIVGIGVRVLGDKSMRIVADGILVAVCATGLLWGTLHNIGLDQEATLDICNIERQLEGLGNGRVKTIPDAGTVLTICPGTTTFTLRRSVMTSQGLTHRFESRFQEENRDVLSGRSIFDFVSIRQVGDQGDYYHISVPRNAQFGQAGLDYVELFFLPSPR